MPMKLLIATPLYPPEIGGPATYAKFLNEGLVAQSVAVTLVKFSNVLRYPKFLRHSAYFGRVCSALRGADAVLTFDTWSTGLPALLAARLRGKKVLARIGGDFLWETYLGRTRELVRLSEFYAVKRDFSLKERLIFAGTRYFVRRADALVFNTAWQKDLWEKVYGFDMRKASVIENEYPAEREQAPARGRVFVAAGRAHPLKNRESLERVFADLKKESSDIELDTRALSPREHEDRVQDAYAVVIPSVSEVSPNTAIDAIRYGKPFIMPYDNGARDRLAGTGMLIDTLDAAALKRAMETLLDPGEYARACERVQAFTFTHTQEAVLDEFLAVLHNICAS